MSAPKLAAVADYPRCGCGRRFPSLDQLRAHVQRDGCPLAPRERRR